MDSSKWLEKVQKTYQHYTPDFEIMKKDRVLFERGVDPKWFNVEENQEAKSDYYSVNLIGRHIKQAVSSLYARDPVPLIKMRDRINYVLWDGTESHYINSKKTVAEFQAFQAEQQQAALQQGIDPSLAVIETPQEVMLANEVIAEYYQLKAQDSQYERLGKTLTCLMNYYITEENVTFKADMKSLITRAKINSVGYCKVGFRRDSDYTPEISGEIKDVRNQISNLRGLVKEPVQGEEGVQDEDERIKEAEMTLESLLQQKTHIKNEGVVFTYPKSDRILIDENCTSLRGFKGADWIAEIYLLTNEEIHEYYDIDISKNSNYSMNNKYRTESGEDSRYGSKNKVFEIYCRKTGNVYVVCEQYEGFLQEPAPPPITIKGMFPYLPLVFAQSERDKQLYSPSDVTLLQPMQNEMNRLREGLRQGRKAALPKYLMKSGALDDDNITKVANSKPHDVVGVVSNSEDDIPLERLFTRVPTANVDPNLYNASPILEDMNMVVGNQPANTGSLSHATATETAIAHGSQATAIDEDRDTLNDFLGDLFEIVGDVMLQNMSESYVKKIVGRGAFWPESHTSQMSLDIYLTIKADSTGRENNAEALRNFERAAPFIMQLPGIDPTVLGEYVLKLVNSNFDLGKAIDPSLPSILATNGQMQVGNAAQEGQFNQSVLSPPEGTQAPIGGNQE